MGQPRREWYLSRKLKVSVKCACQLDYPVGLDIHTLLFVLCCGKGGLWRGPELMHLLVMAFSLVAYAISAHRHIHI